MVKLRLAASLAGGACVVLLALFLHGRYARRRAEPSQRPDSGLVRTAPTTLPGPAGNPAEMTTKPLAGIGLKVLRSEPKDIFAPPGAVRCYGLRRKVPDGAADIVAYTVEAGVAEVEKFYRARLEQEGYKLVQRRPGMRPGGVSLVFMGEHRQNYCVSLRPADKEKKNTKIVLVVARPGR